MNQLLKKGVSTFFLFCIVTSTFAYTPTSQEQTILDKIASLIATYAPEKQEAVIGVLEGYFDQGLDERRTYFATYLIDSIEQRNVDTTLVQHSDVYSVRSITDGDTFVVDIDGREEKVRLIGIDTPEVGDRGYKEGKDALTAFLTSKSVMLEFDQETGMRDKYDRLLAYVYVGDVFINLEMIQLGYAREFTVTDYAKQEEFKQAAAQRIGETTVRRRYCSEFTTCEQAMEALKAGANELDGDDDGEPCEKMC